MTSIKCPSCGATIDPELGIGWGDACPFCLTTLVKPDIAEIPSSATLGDANAISGDVRIDQSRHVSSHDIHYHQTVEMVRTETELHLNAANRLRAEAEAIMAERGRIDSVAMGTLRPLAIQLGIDDDQFKSIIRDVRTNRSGAAEGLSSANQRYLKQAQQAILSNDIESLSNLTPRLEAMASISQDDDVQYLYYLTLSLLYPIKCIETYEHQTDENYWRTFWAIISYIRTRKYAQATNLLAFFNPGRFEKSEEDQNLLEAYFNLMKDNRDETQDFLNEILGEPSPQIRPLLRAVEATLYNKEAESSEVQFYLERVISKADTVCSSNKVNTSDRAEETLFTPADNSSSRDSLPDIFKQAQEFFFNYAGGVDEGKELAKAFEQMKRIIAEDSDQERLAYAYDTLAGILDDDLFFPRTSDFNIKVDHSLAKEYYTYSAALGFDSIFGNTFNRLEGVFETNELLEMVNNAIDIAKSRGDTVTASHLSSEYERIKSNPYSESEFDSTEEADMPGVSVTPSISISNISIEKDALRAGEPGLIFHFALDVNNLLGEDIYVSIWFFFNGSCLKENLYAFDKKWSLNGKDLAVGDVVSSPYENSHWDDFRLFIPYSALTGGGKGHWWIDAMIQAYNPNNKCEDYHKGPVQFGVGASSKGLFGPKEYTCEIKYIPE